MTPIDPTSTGFLFAESRAQPMHVGGLQLFRKPEGAGRNFVKDLYEEMLGYEQPSSLFLKRPHRSLATGGQWFWKEDDQFDLEYHFRHSALPKPGRIRELLELCGRLHSTRLALERPLWEVHLIEGLRDGRVAMYSKMHHALVDGISSMRLVQHVLSKDPDEVGMPPMWSAGHTRKSSSSSDEEGTDPGIFGLSANAVRSALAISADAAGLPAALMKTLTRGVRNETSAVSLYAPRTIINKKITGARRFAAEDWPMERIKAVGKASGTTVNDVVLAMCSGAMRTYFTRAGCPPRRLPRRDGAGRAAGQAVAECVRLRRQRGRRGHGQARHRHGRPGRPTRGHPPLDGRRQGGARHHDAGADPRDERARDWPPRSSRRCCGCRASPGRRST